jgi:hypothetical protein
VRLEGRRQKAEDRRQKVECGDEEGFVFVYGELLSESVCGVVV